MQNKQLWNANWAKWNEDYTPSPFAQKAFKLMKINDMHTVLDVGCGKGRDSLYFASNGMNVTALDVSDEALRALDGLKHPKITTECADVTTAEFGTDKFDAVYACLSLHYFGDVVTRRIVDRLYDALHDGGMMFMRCKSVDDALYGVGEQTGEDMFCDNGGWARHFFSIDYMKDVLKRFETVAVTAVNEDYFGPCAFVDATAIKKQAPSLRA